jgi:hypothetical protein
VIEHGRLADTSPRGLAGADPSPSRQSMEARKGRDPLGARSERSGDDSAVPARLGRETPTPRPTSLCPREPSAPTPTPGIRSGASHGAELFAGPPAMLMAGTTLAVVGVVATVSGDGHFPGGAALASPCGQMKTPTLAGRGSDRRSGSHRPTHHWTVARLRPRFKAVNLRLQMQPHPGSDPLESGRARGGHDLEQQV